MGRLNDYNWWVGKTGEDSYIAQRIIDGKTETHEFSSHCLQCAKVDILAKYGGRVDLRGSHLTFCGSFLRAMQLSINEEELE